MAVPGRLEIARESIDPHVPLCLLAAVAADAILRQKGFKRFLSAQHQQGQGSQ